ncbi:cardiolipin synthase [Palleronia caenipelagi]|uniref:Cardiolipin synthase n=1 Tax=Palleronia caenipelagi TaxID=2489174 RepID=A0A547PNC0_9RHOB|nr:cardiolipin synthase [Palleronia caenipelagi]TRD15636.1 cardiolipin synthase [Palleronia caenipelagi]
MFITDWSDAVFIHLVALVAAFVTAYFALQTSRSPQGAVGWVVLILAFPYIGIPAYIVFGYANYSKFTRERRESDEKFGLAPKVTDGPARPDDRLAIFGRLTGHEIVGGNSMHLMDDVAVIYDEIIAAVDGAEHYVLMQYYEMEDDETGKRFKKALCDKARQGVAVYLMHDEAPFAGLPKPYVAELRDAGVHVAQPKGPSRALKHLQFNHRNHRKLVVVDGTRAFTGGANCGDKYLGKSKVGAWRDTFAEFNGPIVDQLQLSYAGDWAWATEENISGVFRKPETAGDLRAVSMPIGPSDRLDNGNLYFAALAQRARKRLWITTPYFAPDPAVMNSMQLAAARGVDLKIMVPDIPEKRVPFWAAHVYFDHIRRAGGEIWRYKAGFSHQKIALIDDDLVSIGSVNMDVRSGLLNFELTVMVEGEEAAQAVEEMLNRDLEQAYRVEKTLDDQPFWLRVAARVSSLFAPQL